jgi:hypothetical protein
LQEYEITKEGRIFSLTHNWRGYGRREMIQHLNADGYAYVRLTLSGMRKNHMVHILVAETFLGKRPPCHQVRHLDGIKTHNNVENLAWGTAKENADDRERHGKTIKGEKCKGAKLSRENVNSIRDQAKTGLTGVEIAKTYKVTPSAICALLKGRSWNHV